MASAIPKKFGKARSGRSATGMEQPRGRIKVVSGVASYAPSDAFGQKRALAPVELATRYRNAQYVCAKMNATQIASLTKRLYSTTSQGQRTPTAKTVKYTEIGRRRMERGLEWDASVTKRLAGVDRVDEVVESPIIDVFRRPNPWLTQSDLIELSQLYREIIGTDFWYWVEGPGDRPIEIWPLPSWMVYVQPDYVGTNVIQNFIFTGGGSQSVLDPSRIIFGRELNLIDPYTQSTSWLRANSELSDIYDDQVSYRRSTLANRGRPDAMLVPKEEGGELTVDPNAIIRIQQEYMQEYGKGGAGRLWVPPGGMELKPISWRPTDMGEIAMSSSVLHDVARASNIPIPLIDGSSANRANGDAALLTYARFALRPRARRLTEHWNMNLIPLWDQDDDGKPLERQWYAFDDPVLADRVVEREDNVAGVTNGWLAVNEVRVGMGLMPAKGGDILRVPSGYLPIDEANKVKAPVEGDGVGNPAVKRNDKHKNGKKRTVGAEDKPHEEGDDNFSSDGKKKGLEDENRLPFDDSGVPGHSEILVKALRNLGLADSWTDASISPHQRQQVLDAIRLQSREWLRAEAERSYPEIIQVEKALGGEPIRVAAAFFGRVKKFIREAFIAGALALMGPKDLSRGDLRAIDENVKTQVGYLGRFYNDLIGRSDDSQFTLAGFANRTEMYGGSVWGGSQNVARIRMFGSRVVDEECRVHLGPRTDKDPCEECSDLESEGWRPVGSLPAIGTQICMNSCHCVFRFRDSSTGEEFDVGGGPWHNEETGERG
jgi:phage portal protein BeeE